MATASKLKSLERMLCEATGSDQDLDRSIASTLGGTTADNDLPSYTSSVDNCIGLIETTLPKWHWHIGHGPAGIVPYASLRREGGAARLGRLRVEASACTVPLALLHATVKALQAELQF